MTDDEDYRSQLLRRGPIGEMILVTLEHAEWRQLVRDRLAQREHGVTRTSIAREIGMPAQMLTYLLNGAELTPQFAARVRAWAEVRYRHGTARPVVHGERVALDLLAIWVRATKRQEAAAELVEFLRAWWRRYGVSVPPAIDRNLDGD